LIFNGLRAYLKDRAFCSLVHNTLKFSKAEVPPRVAIGCSIIEDEQRDWAQISIEDNGIRLDDAYSERIFRAFDRLPSKNQDEGSGVELSRLGLYVAAVLKAAEKHILGLTGYFFNIQACPG